MTNLVQPGATMEYNNSGAAISSGDIVPLVDRCGIAVVDIAATSGEGSLSLEGVYSAPKDADEAFEQGDALFYDASDSTLTKTAAGNTPFGIAFEAAASDATTCVAQLAPQPKRAANVAFSAGSNLVGVDGAGSNAAPLAGTETRLDAIDTAIAAILTSLKNAALMKNA
jgi:predicted RecA/RadA family phage recombinase